MSLSLALGNNKVVRGKYGQFARHKPIMNGGKSQKNDNCDRQQAVPLVKGNYCVKEGRFGVFVKGLSWCTAAQTGVEKESCAIAPRTEWAG